MNLKQNDDTLALSVRLTRAHVTCYASWAVIWYTIRIPPQPVVGVFYFKDRDWKCRGPSCWLLPPSSHLLSTTNTLPRESILCLTLWLSQSLRLMLLLECAHSLMFTRVGKRALGAFREGKSTTNHLFCATFDVFYTECFPSRRSCPLQCYPVHLWTVHQS